MLKWHHFHVGYSLESAGYVLGGDAEKGIQSLQIDFNKFSSMLWYVKWIYI